jgi:hypothetical protein
MPARAWLYAACFRRPNCSGRRRPWRWVEKAWGGALLNGNPRENDLERSVAFAEQERVVGRIDNSGKRCAAFRAIEPIAFEAAGVDVGIGAAAEVQPRMALRALRNVARRGIARQCCRTLVTHRRPMIRKLSGDVFYNGWTEILLKVDRSNPTGPIGTLITKSCCCCEASGSGQPARRVRPTYEEILATGACCLALGALASNSIRRSNKVERKNG